MKLALVKDDGSLHVVDGHIDAYDLDKPMARAEIAIAIQLAVKEAQPKVQGPRTQWSMFTKRGNARLTVLRDQAVHQSKGDGKEAARLLWLGWRRLCRYTPKGLTEISDTAVREAVWDEGLRMMGGEKVWNEANRLWVDVANEEYREFRMKEEAEGHHLIDD